MISPTWGFPPRRRQRWGQVERNPEHPLSGIADATTDPKPGPDLAVSLALPGRMPPGRPRWPPVKPRPRSRASVPGALHTWALSGGLLPIIHGVVLRNGQNSRPHQTRWSRRPNPCRERWRRSSPRPPPSPKGRWLRLGLLQFHLHDQLRRIRLHRAMTTSSAFADRPCVPLSERIDPGDRLHHATARGRKSPRPTCPDKSSTGSAQKPQGNLTLARHRPPLGSRQRACTKRNL